MFSKIRFKIFGLYDFLMNFFAKKMSWVKNRRPEKLDFLFLLKKNRPEWKLVQLMVLLMVMLMAPLRQRRLSLLLKDKKVSLKEKQKCLEIEKPKI